MEKKLEISKYKQQLSILPSLPLPPIISINPPTLSKTLGKLVNNSCYSDITFMVSEKPFYGHKSIVSIRSSHLKELIGESQVIEIPFISPEAFSFFLEYLYTSNISTTNESLLYQLKFAAQSFQLLHLIEICKEF